MIRILFLLVLNLSTEVEHSVGNPKIEFESCPCHLERENYSVFNWRKQSSLKKFCGKAYTKEAPLGDAPALFTNVRVRWKWSDNDKRASLLRCGVKRFLHRPRHNEANLYA